MDYVLATSRSWNEILAQRLQESTGHRFNLIKEKEALSLEYLRKINPRYVFFPHWSYRIPSEIHQAHECVIFHMTDLPYGRGGSPLQNLIMRGHTETKISALRCSDVMDGGPIYAKRALSLKGSAAEIFVNASQVIESMIQSIVNDEPTPQPQVGTPVIFESRTPAQSDLAQAPIQSLNDFFDFIRMLDADGYPRAFLGLHGHRIELSRVQMKNDSLEGKFAVYRQAYVPSGSAGGAVKMLLDRCYPNPPRDVYQRMLDCYRVGDPLYSVELGKKVVGIVYLARNSKGGHLENLAVDPEYRGCGLADCLVDTLITDNPGAISLTTRIPDFFQRHRFKPIQRMPDKTQYMVRI